ncbi:MAG: polysaccharide pyruvyl transferase family protein [Prevotellaceae bacterium]|nr:polysaccharide pyruvyl transferase family protein [Prevotellaceae bacterium]
MMKSIENKGIKATNTLKNEVAGKTKPFVKDISEVMMKDNTRKINKSLYYWAGRNFGDELNKSLFEKVFGIQFNYCTSCWQADYIAIGSLLGFSCSVVGYGSIKRNLIDILKGILKGGMKLSKITVLGSGFQNWSDEYKIKYLRKMDFKIVRGRLSENYLRKNKILKTDVVLGDLGLLAPYMIKNESKKYKLGIVPHYIDLGSPLVFDIYKKHYPDCIIINVQDNVEMVIKQISECETIISSSLHGLIVADSYGVPNLWMENTLRYGMQDRYKYHDYYSIYDLDKMEPVNLFELMHKNIEDINKEYKIKIETVKNKQKELYEYCKGYFNGI